MSRSVDHLLRQHGNPTTRELVGVWLGINVVLKGRKRYIWFWLKQFYLLSSLWPNGQHSNDSGRCVQCEDYFYFFQQLSSQWFKLPYIHTELQRIWHEHKDSAAVYDLRNEHSYFTRPGDFVDGNLHWNYKSPLDLNGMLRHNYGNERTLPKSTH